MKRIASITMTGLSAMVAQLLLMRELMVVGLGDELTIAFSLFAWLLWTGVGSAAGGLLARKINPPPFVVGSLMAAVGALLPLSIIWVRALSGASDFHYGELMPLGGILILSLTAQGPVCLITGLLFPIFCRVSETEKGSGASGAVYSWETLGSVIGALAFSLALIRVLSPLAAALLVGALQTCACATWFGRRARAAIWPAVAAIVLTSPLWLASAARLSRDAAWGRHVEFSAESGYGNVTVIKDDEQLNLYTSGRFAGTIPDSVLGEYSAHVPLLAHPDPKRVLLIGGSAVMIREILKHGVDKLIFVELDPLVIELKKRLGPERLRRVYEDPRVEIVARDPRLFLSKYQGTFDVILLNAGAPETLRSNRYFTSEFLTILSGKLDGDGLAALQVPFSENYLGREKAALLGSIVATFLHQPSVAPILIPGRKTFLLWSPKSPLSVDPADVVSRFNERRITSEHFSADSAAYYFDKSRIDFALSQFSDNIMEYSMSKDKTAAAFKWLTEQEGARVNTDARPIATYLNSLFTASHYGSRAGRLIEYAGRIVESGAFAVVALLIAAACFILGWLPGAGRRIALFSGTFIAGFAGILIEILMLFQFQVKFGVTYLHAGTITAFFIGGTAAGAAVTAHALKTRSSTGKSTLVAACALLAAAPAINLAFLSLSAASGASVGPVDAFVIFATAFTAGAGLGGIFPWVVSAWSAGSNAPEAGAAGFLYFADLAGACSGALLAGVALVPLLGVDGSLRFAIFASLAATAAFAGPAMKAFFTA